MARGAIDLILPRLEAAGASVHECFCHRAMTAAWVPWASASLIAVEIASVDTKPDTMSGPLTNEPTGKRGAYVRYSGVTSQPCIVLDIHR